MLDTTVQPNQSSTEESARVNQMRVALLVEYCGESFYGSQFQPGLPTVQGALEDALRQLKLPASAVSFAGRTDAGVNARGQVAHFDVDRSALENVPNLVKALNAFLPETISVRDVQLDVGFNFNSRREAVCKWYRYSIYNGASRSVWATRQGCLHYANRLDADKMRQAAELLLGCHNFKSFKDPDTHVTNDVCTLRHVNVTRDGDFINFDVVADRFLYKMVRNITGQLMAIGHAERALSPEMILQVLGEQDRAKAAATARPEGLSLMAIQYSSPFNFFAQDITVRQLETILKPNKMESLQNENLFRKAS